MNIEDAIDVIESVSGFTDESTPVGEAWREVLSYLYRPPVHSEVLPAPELGETREAVTWLERYRDQMHPVHDSDDIAQFARIATLLEQLSAPAPVPPTDEELLEYAAKAFGFGGEKILNDDTSPFQVFPCDVLAFARALLAAQVRPASSRGPGLDISAADQGVSVR